MAKKHITQPVFQNLDTGGSGGGADVSGVTATAGDVDTGKVFVNSAGAEVIGTSTYKSAYTALNTLVGQTTAVAEDVASGKLFINANGVQTTGTASGGGSDENFIKMIERPNISYLSITLPSSTTEIGAYVFYNFSRLYYITIPNSVTTIGTSAFQGCSKLQMINLPNSLITISQSAFQGCTSLSAITIPSSVTTIYGYAFSGCALISSVTFQGTPTTIYNTAFYNCTNLTTIRVPWSEGAVSGAPWGASNATITYNYTP